MAPLLFLLFLAAAAAETAAATSTVSQLRSGAWGYLSFQSNSLKCWGAKKDKETWYLFTYNCHTDVHVSHETLLWR